MRLITVGLSLYYFPDSTGYPPATIAEWLKPNVKELVFPPRWRTAFERPCLVVDYSLTDSFEPVKPFFTFFFFFSAFCLALSSAARLLPWIVYSLAGLL